MNPTSNPIVPGANTALLTNGAPPTICKICVQYAFARHRWRLATEPAAGTKELLACRCSRTLTSLSNLETVVENPPIFSPPTQVHHVRLARSSA
jgi:hypothetical protein